MHSLKKWFTMIEILVVIVILWVLMGTLKNVFKPSNKDTLYGQICINRIYWDINNYLNAWVTSKWIYVDNQALYPKDYTIRFLPEMNSISLEYTLDNNSTGIRKTLELTWNSLPGNYSCKDNSYLLKIQGQTTQVTLKRWLQSETNLPTFQIIREWNLLFTGTVAIHLCLPDQTICRQFSEYAIDARTKHIKNRICLSFTGPNNIICKEWNQ